MSGLLSMALKIFGKVGIAKVGEMILTEKADEVIGQLTGVKKEKSVQDKVNTLNTATDAVDGLVGALITDKNGNKLIDGKKATKLVRPLIALSGPVFIIAEMFGLRALAFKAIYADGVPEAIMTSSNNYINAYLAIWGIATLGFISARTLEKIAGSDMTRVIAEFNGVVKETLPGLTDLANDLQDDKK